MIGESMNLEVFGVGVQVLSKHRTIMGVGVGVE